MKPKAAESVSHRVAELNPVPVPESRSRPRPSHDHDVPREESFSADPVDLRVFDNEFHQITEQNEVSWNVCLADDEIASKRDQLWNLMNNL